MATMVAKMALKSMVKEAKNQAVATGRKEVNQMTKNAISFGTTKLNQAQAKAANKMGAVAIGMQGGAPVMVGPKGGNFRMNNKGQRINMLKV